MAPYVRDGWVSYTLWGAEDAFGLLAGNAPTAKTESKAASTAGHYARAAV